MNQLRNITSGTRCITMTLMLTAVILACTIGTASAHPSDGRQPRDLSAVWSPEVGLPPEWSTGDLVFTKPKPAWQELTPAEQYIIAGTVTSPFGNESLKPWEQEIFLFVRRYFEQYGAIPERLSPEVIRQAPGYAGYSDARLEVFRSPLTGEFPRLNAASFSPGDVYIRPLTPGEMQYFAQRNPVYNADWFGKGTVVDPNSHDPINTELGTDVYYIRIYGASGVIVDGLEYILSR